MCVHDRSGKKCDNKTKKRTSFIRDILPCRFTQISHAAVFWIENKNQFFSHSSE